MTDEIVDCNGCAECVHCGRSRIPRLVTFCDKCREEIEGTVYSDEKGRDLCEFCYEQENEEDE